jgi:hypothetical protein
LPLLRSHARKAVLNYASFPLKKWSQTFVSFDLALSFLPIFSRPLCICNVFVDRRIIYYNSFKYHMKYCSRIFHLNWVCSALHSHESQITGPSCYYLMDHSRLYTEVRKIFPVKDVAFIKRIYAHLHQPSVSTSCLNKGRFYSILFLWCEFSRCIL